MKEMLHHCDLLITLPEKETENSPIKKIYETKKFFISPWRVMRIPRKSFAQRKFNLSSESWLSFFGVVATKKSFKVKSRHEKWKVMTVKMELNEEGTLFASTFMDFFLFLFSPTRLYPPSRYFTTGMTSDICRYSWGRKRAEGKENNKIR